MPLYSSFAKPAAIFLLLYDVLGEDSKAHLKKKKALTREIAQWTIGITSPFLKSIFLFWWKNKQKKNIGWIWE